MVEGVAKLIVDIGNSSTKGMVLFGKNEKTGKFNARQFEISNVFGIVQNENYEVTDDYNPSTSTILSIDTVLNGNSIRGHFSNGELQEKEFYQSVIRPSARLKKYDNDTTALSIRMAFLYAYKALLKMTGVSDFSELNINWEVITLLPPGDIDLGKDKMTAIVKGVDRVDCVYPKCSFKVKIDTVTILPEGFCAYAGIVYDNGLVFRQGYKYLTENTVLVLDIGAGTTDILLIKDNKQVKQSRFTIDQGGNNIESKVKVHLNQLGYSLDPRAITEGVITGKIKVGSKTVDIVDDINNAKEVVAGNIISSVVEYLESADIRTSSIGYLIICGGGSIDDATDKGIRSLSDLILDKFKAYVPNAEKVKIPEHEVLEELADGDVKKVTKPISPRDLNLIGASILAERI